MSKGIEKLREEYHNIKYKISDLAIELGGSVSVEPINQDFLHWKGCIPGPKNSPYSGGLFFFEIKFDSNYPYSAPDIQMRTPIYHPNIAPRSGHISTDLLHNWNKWNDNHDVYSLILEIFCLLARPNEQNAYQPYKKDPEKAKEFTYKYATQSQEIDWNNSWDKGWNNN